MAWLPCFFDEEERELLRGKNCFMVLGELGRIWISGVEIWGSSYWLKRLESGYGHVTWDMFALLRRQVTFHQHYFRV